MIIQPEWGTRNVNQYFYESETRRIAAFNEIFGEIELTEDEQRILIWLAGWDEYTMANMLSVIRKAMAAEVKRLEQPLRFGRCRADVPRTSCTPGRAQRQLLMDGTVVKSAFALLSAKVTKEGLRELLMFGKVPLLCAVSGADYPDREKGYCLK